MIPGCGDWARERKTELAGSRHCYHATDYNFMLLGMPADRQLRLLEGGSIALVRPIENRYRDLGGQIIYRSTVEEILVDDGKALGVRLSDGSEDRSDARDICR